MDAAKQLSSGSLVHLHSGGPVMANAKAAVGGGSGFDFLRRVGLDTIKIFLDPDTSPRCAAAAFFGFLSFFPALATVALVYGLVANGPLVAETVNSLSYFLPAMTLDVLDEQLKLLAAAPPVTVGIGLLISIPLA